MKTRAGYYWKQLQTDSILLYLIRSSIDDHELRFAAYFVCLLIIECEINEY